jgi:hypothetical protein
MLTTIDTLIIINTSYEEACCTAQSLLCKMLHSGCRSVVIMSSTIVSVAVFLHKTPASRILFTHTNIYINTYSPANKQLRSSAGVSPITVSYYRQLSLSLSSKDRKDRKCTPGNQQSQNMPSRDERASPSFETFYLP